VLQTIRVEGHRSPLIFPSNRARCPQHKTSGETLSYRRSPKQLASLWLDGVKYDILLTVTRGPPPKLSYSTVEEVYKEKNLLADWKLAFKIEVDILSFEWKSTTLNVKPLHYL
jgi:hypothetical protein